MPEMTLRVLLVEDDEDDYLLVRDYLGEANGAMIALEWASTYEAGLAAFARRAHDVALIDYRLGAHSGLDLLQAARLAGNLPPAIILTGAGDPAVDAASQAAGAADYLVKGRLDASALERAIRYALDRARQRAVLSNAQDFLQATVDALAAHIAVLDDQGTIVAVNSAWRRFARENNYPGGACGLGQNYLAVCDAAARAGETDAASMAAAVRDLLAGQRTTFEQEYPCHAPTERRWFVSRVTRFAGDGPVRIVVTHEAVTARRLAEEGIRFQAHLLDQVPAAVIATDAAGIVTHWNAHATALYGWALDEVLGQPIHTLTVGPTDPAITADIRAQLSIGKSWSGEFMARHKDNTTFPAHITDAPILDEQGRPVGVVGVSVDITSRTAVQAVLRASELSLAEAQRIAHVGSWEYDQTTNALRWSDEFFRIAGFVPRSFEPTLEQTLALIHPEERAYVADNFLDVAVGTPTEVEFRLVRPDGEVRSILQRAESLTDTTGRPERRFAVARDVTDQRSLERQLVRQATHDPLTGLPNRALLFDRLDRALARARRDGRSSAVLYLDLDRFKDVNDTLGHDAGDRLLVAVTARLRDCLREEDTLARQGGDEFTILLEDTTDVNAAARVAERLAAVLAVPFAIAGQEHRVTTSIGIVLATSAYERPEDLLRDADIAMYRAKESGKARYAIFDAAMQAGLVARLGLERDLRRAVETGGLALHYQPIIDLRTGMVTEVEALARWSHPQRGFVPPSEFIVLAEESGLIRTLGRWVIEEACRQARAWQLAGTPVAISVNLTAREFQHPSLAGEITAALVAAGLDARWLWLEITESLAMNDPDASIATLAALRALGVAVAIDDFGTGYSSLAYLQRLPVDVLKIDQVFINGLGTETEDTSIVTAIITLAHTLGLRVVAEGVETAAQADRLRALDCDLAQGYYFARPRLATDAAPLWSGPLVYHLPSDDYAA